MTSVIETVAGAMKAETEVISDGGSQDLNEKCSNVLGKITGQDIDYWISKRKVLIGRNSSQGSVDINIGFSSYVSRKHLVLNYERGRFFLSCVGKNGVFVDGQFNRLGGNPVPLDNVCTIRFPSTSIRLTFDPCPPGITRLNGTVPKKVEQDGRNPLEEHDNSSATKLPLIGSNNIKPEVFSTSNLSNIENGLINNNKNLSMGSPTQIAKHLLSRGARGYLSAPPSPTGTISAVNSCPTSPRSQTPQYPMQHLNDVTAENLAAAASAIAASVGEDHQKHLENNLNGNTPADSKPPYSYAQLIIQAISSSPQHQLTLSGIYAHITKHYPYYRTADKGWQNSIRHNLSLNRYFVKVPRSQEESGKGSFWRVDPASERKLVEQAWRKRRQQRTVPHCFCTPITASISTITRSAPVSPDRSEILSSSIHKPLTSVSPFTGANSSQIQLEQNQKLQIVQLTTAAAAAAGYPHSTPASPLTPSTNLNNDSRGGTTVTTIQPIASAGDKMRWPPHPHQQAGFESKPAVSILLRPPASSSVPSSSSSSSPSNPQQQQQQIFQTQNFQQQQQQQIVQIDSNQQRLQQLQQQQQQFQQQQQQLQLQQQIQQQQLQNQQQQSHLSTLTAAAALQNTINSGNSVFLTSNISTIKRENESYNDDEAAAKKAKVLDETNGKGLNS